MTHNEKRPGEAGIALADWQQLSRSWLLTAALLLIIATTGVHLLVFASSVLIPILFGFYLSVLLYAPMIWLSRLFIPQAIGALILVLAVFGTMVGGLLLLKEPATSWIQTAPAVMQKLKSQTPGLQETLDEMESRTSEVENIVDGAIPSENSKVEADTIVIDQPNDDWRETVFSKITSFVWALSVTLILCYFFLVGGDPLARNISMTFRHRSQRVSALKLMRKLRSSLAQYIFVTMCVNLSFGVVIGLVLWVFGAEYAMLWGILVGLMRYIPYVGNVLSLIAVTAAVATANLEVGPLIAAPAITAVLMFICGNFIDPMVHARKFELNPIVIFGSIIFWSWIWGVAGLFIAVPTLLVIAVTCGHVGRLRRFHLILCSDSDLNRSPAKRRS
ncbi:AI-2E family transporter [Allohahella marinimesophila]|uniref:AI-2E family transporter n=1 Tax=Allohahella marinimesophila TaxID=1054972 RepID=A0ABP7P6V2_9GAMM